MPDTPTTRLGLYKSAANGSELVNYTQDLGNNWDKVDAASGFQIVTSSTRPATPYAGKPIAESDTGYRTYFSNGTTPASASWVEIPNSSGTYNGNLNLASGRQLNIGGSGSTASYAISLPTSADYALSARVSADAYSRITIRADGELVWGSGSVFGDTVITRGAANRLDLTTADFRIATVGRGLRVAEGTNAKMGVATLVAGAVTVANTSVTANSRIHITRATAGGTLGHLSHTKTAATSFTVTSSSATETSVVNWFIVEP